MESLFEKKIPEYALTKPLSKNIECEKAYIVYSQFHNLPNNRVLFITRPYNEKRTLLKIFSTKDLSNPIVENVLEMECLFLGVFPNGSLLLRTLLGPKLIKLSAEDLTVILSQKSPWWYSVGIIDNDSFFIVKSSYTKENYKFFRLAVYKQKADAFLKVHDAVFKISSQLHSVSTHTLYSLGHSRYACHFQGDNTSEFKVLLFEINPNTYEVIENGVICPSQGYSPSSLASGTCVILSNGNVLTYHACTDHVQIWNTLDFTCVKEWDWKTIQAPKAFSVSCLNILAFPDSRHLLIIKGETCYLFDTEKNILKQVLLNDKLEPFGRHFILPNGEVLACIKQDNKEKLKVMHFDVKEMENYRKCIIDKHQIASWCLNKKNKIPKPVVNIIFSFAFTQTEKETWISNPSHLTPKNL